VVEALLTRDQAEGSPVTFHLFDVVDAAHDALHASVEVLENPVERVAVAVAKVVHGRQHQRMPRVCAVLVVADALVRDEPGDAAAAVGALQEGDQVRAVAPLREILEVAVVAAQGLALAQFHPHSDVANNPLTNSLPLVRHVELIRVIALQV